MRAPILSTTLFALVGCHAFMSSGGGSDDDAYDAEPPLVTVAFTEDPSPRLDPERGFYNGIDLVSGTDFSSIRASGMTLALAEVPLDAYISTDLPQTLLDDLTAGFARVRAAGIKVVLRFNYNDGPIGAPDASLAQVQAHIAELTPVLVANADVIAFMQAGLIGTWGEWHDSTNGLDTTPNELAIVDALLVALPDKRMIQIRTPEFVDAMFPGGPLSDGFDGSPRSRIGQHNDCFLASDTDFGTYTTPIDTWKAYVAADTRFTPMGGETCAVDSPRSDCPTATAEMAQLHYTYLNSAYQQGVLSGWTTQGCMPQITEQLGYRLVLESATLSQRVKPGGRLQLQVALHNAGYASPLNPRPLRVVLDNGTTREVATLADDVRRWGSGEQSIDVTLRVPSTLAAGTYRLSLWLPDPDLEDRPEYAIGFANVGVADPTGLVVLEPSLVIDPQAPGESVDACDFAPIPD